MGKAMALINIANNGVDVVVGLPVLVETVLSELRDIK